jgi:flagellar hook-associated protein 1
MSISSLLFTSRDSLLAHQMAIDVTGANVANVNTPGYTRQRVDMKAQGFVEVKAAATQIGVTVDRVERLSSSYIESQIIEQQQNSGYSDALLQGLQNIELILDETQGGGVSDQLNKFWSAWENLSNNPAGTVERSALLTASESLTDTLSSYKRDLDTISADMNTNIIDTVSEINNKVEEIRSLNAKIVGAMGSEYGDNNDLFDKRTQALKELAQLVDINQFENADGTINVNLSNGDSLVQSIIGHPLTVQPGNGDQSDVYSSQSIGEAINSALTKGKLGAYIELQSGIVPEYRDDINSFAIALANRVNELHNSGFDAYQNMGTDFFEISDMGNAGGSIRVSSDIITDTNRIAASLTVSGDGENASRMAAIQNELLTDGNTATLNSFISSIVGKIGNQVDNAQMNSDHQTVIMNHLDNQRESASGVSIDEEMVLLMKYQMGYTASGKLCQTVNDMLDTLMGLIR